MDLSVIYFLIAVVIFFPVLYLIVIPVLRKISMILFNRSFRIGGFSPGDYRGENAVGVFDVFMTYVCFGVALAVSLWIAMYAAELGIIMPVTVDK